MAKFSSLSLTPSLSPSLSLSLFLSSCPIINFVADECLNGSVQLMGGAAANEGIVIYCNGGTWVSLIDASLYGPQGDWDETEARVVCLQLGYSGTG